MDKLKVLHCVHVTSDNDPGSLPRVESVKFTRQNIKLRTARGKTTALSRQKILCPMDVKPTLSQIWNRDKLNSAICIQSVDVHVSCSSHGITELAPFFIDRRAK